MKKLSKNEKIDVLREARSRILKKEYNTICWAVFYILEEQSFLYVNLSCGKSITEIVRAFIPELSHKLAKKKFKACDDGFWWDIGDPNRIRYLNYIIKNLKGVKSEKNKR